MAKRSQTGVAKQESPGLRSALAAELRGRVATGERDCGRDPGTKNALFVRPARPLANLGSPEAVSALERGPDLTHKIFELFGAKVAPIVCEEVARREKEDARATAD
jgi:hypothetical protein